MHNKSHQHHPQQCNELNTHITAGRMVYIITPVIAIRNGHQTTATLTKQMGGSTKNVQVPAQVPQQQSPN